MNKLLSALLFICGASVAQEVPVPERLQAKYIATDTANYIHLTWERKNEGDEVTVGYNVLANFQPEDKFVVLGNAGLIFKNEYYFKVNTIYSAKYKFAVMGVNNFPEIKRSSMSNVVEIITPSIALPNIEIDELKLRGGQIALKWNYRTDIADLAGFRVYVNDELFVNEEEVDGDTHRLYFSYNEKGKYVFQVLAVTDSGLESRPSQKRIIDIE